MKKPLLFLILLPGLFSGQLSGQTTLARWTFEGLSLSSSLNTSPTVLGGSLSANSGSGSATGVHASNSFWITPTGNGSNKSLAASTWAVGDYFQFQTSSTGYAGLAFTWDQQSTQPGPRDFTFSYSLDGVNFTNVLNYSVIEASPSWNNSTPQTGTSTNFSLDLSSVSALANSSSVYFRLTNTSTVAVDGGSVASNGFSLIDNFNVSGTAIPEPPMFAFGMSLLSVIGVVGWKRSRGRSHS